VREKLAAFFHSLTDRRGVTLLEMAMVAAIIAILSSLAAVGVAGTAQESRGTARGSDIDTVQKGVLGYSAQQPQGKYPTLDGCLPGQTFNPSTKLCDAGTDPGPFNSNNSSTFKAIIWGKAFTTDGTTKTLVPTFLAKVPKHGFEHTDGTLWDESTVTDPDGVVAAGLRAPTTGKTPVWVLDRDGTVQVTLSESQY
jgi:prepilin-type N-terminal cleavage/methylation domain-containing protein